MITISPAAPSSQLDQSGQSAQLAPEAQSAQSAQSGQVGQSAQLGQSSLTPSQREFLLAINPKLLCQFCIEQGIVSPDDFDTEALMNALGNEVVIADLFVRDPIGSMCTALRDNANPRYLSKDDIRKEVDNYLNYHLTI